MNKLLITIILYSILVSASELYFYLVESIFRFDDISINLFIVNSVLAAFFLGLLLTNISILIDKSPNNISYKYNIVIFFFQVFHLKFYGFIFEFSSGIEFIPYFSTHEGYFFGLQYDIWNRVFVIFFSEDLSNFTIGVNLVSIIVLYIYYKNYLIVKHSRS